MARAEVTTLTLDGESGPAPHRHTGQTRAVHSTTPDPISSVFILHSRHLYLSSGELGPRHGSQNHNQSTPAREPVDR